VGENAFVAYTVVQVLRFSWQAAVAAMFLAGALFVLLAAARVWPWLDRRTDDPSRGLRFCSASWAARFWRFLPV